MEEQITKAGDIAPDLTVEGDDEGPPEEGTLPRQYGGSQWAQDVMLAVMGNKGDEKGFMLALVQLRRRIDRSPREGNWMESQAVLSEAQQRYSNKTLITTEAGNIPNSCTTRVVISALVICTVS